jgi:predicted protein tyrosine phosphatase
MHKIIVMSRDQAIKHSYHFNIDECVIISIGDVTQGNAKFNRNNPKIKGVLRLFFSDIEYQTETGIIMNENDAKMIKEFIDLHKEKVQSIVVHCQAGISRSSAIGAVIEKYLNGEESELNNIWKAHNYSPNGHCYKLCCKAFGFDVTEDDIIKLKDINNKSHDEWLELEENSELKEMFNRMFGEVIKE